MQSSELSQGVACMTKHFPEVEIKRRTRSAFCLSEKDRYPGNNSIIISIPLKLPNAWYCCHYAFTMVYPWIRPMKMWACRTTRPSSQNCCAKNTGLMAVVCNRLGSDQRCTHGARCSLGCQAWGVESLTRCKGYKNTGSLLGDQFGGENKPERWFS